MAGDLSPILEIAREILSTCKAPMHVGEISEEAVRSNRSLQLSKDDFQKKLSGALAANLKTSSPSFAKVPSKTGGLKKGVYRLKVRRAASSTKPLQPKETITPPSANFLGKAGEHAVMAELLYRGFNASLMAVDEGVDIVAAKNNEYFHIQVKTSSQSVNGKYTFFIKNAAFEANNGGKVFYILVMRSSEGVVKFAVIPSMQLAINRDSGVVGGTNGISLFVTPDEKGRSFVMNKGQNIDHFINNFSLIR
ncbi:MAG: hypothetical protein LCH90_02390 [Proteobacteria bacterium]|nr:hypothetical protein [Pseudomonadota bacterium]